MAIPVAPGLKDAVEARGLQIADWKTLYDDLAAAHAKRKAAADASFANLKASSDFIIAGFEEVKSLAPLIHESGRGCWRM